MATHDNRNDDLGTRADAADAGIGSRAAKKHGMVVAALIATVSFQAVMAPPGGFWQEDSKCKDRQQENSVPYSRCDHSAGTAALLPNHYNGFMLSNILAFFASFLSVYLLLFDLWHNAGFFFIGFAGSSLGSAIYIAIKATKPKQSADLDVIAVILIVASIIVFLIAGWRSNRRKT